MKQYNLAVILYTYDRVDDALINQEIIRNLWSKSELLKDIKIYHVYNGKKERYIEKYREDYFARIENSGHFQGASELFDLGFKKVVESGFEADYLVFLASDTWVVNKSLVESTLQKMDDENKLMAGNSWDGLPDKPGDILKSISVDLLFLNYKWARKNKIFPLDYSGFKRKYGEVFYYQGGVIMLEKLLLSHFIRAIHEESGNDVEFRAIARSKIFQIFEREPVHSHINNEGNWVRKMYWPEIGLITHHDPKEKQKIVKLLKLHFGENLQKFINSNDLSYFNKFYVKLQKTN